MTRDATDQRSSLLDAWIGTTCTVVDRHEYSWSFGFGDAGRLNVECPWRIIAEGRIALGDTDDGHKFGLPEPLDGEARAHGLLVGKQVTAVRIEPLSADLQIVFEENAILELFNKSAGYEAWNAVIVRDGKCLNVTAHGGGAISTFETPDPPQPGVYYGTIR